MRGIRLWKGGRQAYIEIHGKTYSKTFPLTDPITKLQAWREAQRLKYGRVRAARDSFAADIQAYLARIEALPTYKQRAAHLDAWAAALGRDRAPQPTRRDAPRVACRSATLQCARDTPECRRRRNPAPRARAHISGVAPRAMLGAS